MRPQFSTIMKSFSCMEKFQITHKLNDINAFQEGRNIRKLVEEKYRLLA